MVRAAYATVNQQSQHSLWKTALWSFLNVVLQPFCRESCVTIEAIVEAYVEMALSSLVCRTH